MDPSIWSKCMYSSSNIFHDRCTAEYLSSLHTDFPPSNSDLLGASVSSHKDNEYVKLLPERVYCNSSNAGSSSVCCRHPELSLSRKSHLSRRRDPSSNSSHEWNMNSGHQAKRARVENIIKGMTCSNIVQYTNVMTNEQQPDNVQEKRSIQQLPLHHEGHGAGNNSSATSQKDACEDLYKFENRKNQGWKKLKLMKYTRFKPERTKLMADVLKYELSRAVTKSIDSIFKNMPQLQTSTNKGSYQSPLCKDNKINLPRNENAKLQDEEVQTEALSLVVPRPRLETSDMFRCGSRDHHLHGVKPPLSDSFSSIPHEEELSPTNTNQRALTSSDAEQAMFDVFGSHPVKVRSKVNSRCVTSLTVDPTSQQSLRLPHVKMESDGPAKNNLYPTNEGLSTNHLKKAKLMFFYTRYPSSQVLKMCFHDVQFTRCISSQLIKWFSNFREFFYIQMEKFARRALADGVFDVRGLTVGRESELFRSLNMHYNKASDFQVPNRFLEVAEITLKEFHIAISLGKDRDPSWKKAIYKVICKLDSDVPAEFRNDHSTR